MSKILLSICIPTNRRIEILKNTLDSIFSQGVDFCEYEVVLSDNSKTDELPELLKQYSQIPNIKYHKTEVVGFMNSINALSLGCGELLKLHNNYTIFKEGSLNTLLDTIRRYKQTKPPIFFSNGSLKNISIQDYATFDEFMYNLSYLSSWSTGISFWNTDFKEYSKIEFDKMFPHTSLLFKQSNRKLFVIQNEVLFYNQDIAGKGGYNLFKTFCIDYLSLVVNTVSRGDLRISTFKHIKKHMLLSFLTPWYYATHIKKNDFTYDLRDIKSSMSIFYTSYHYYFMILGAWFLYPVKLLLVKLFKS